jgi:hypothetical protein
MDHIAVFVCSFISITTRCSPKRLLAHPNSSARALLEVHANAIRDPLVPSIDRIDDACVDGSMKPGLLDGRDHLHTCTSSTRQKRDKLSREKIYLQDSAWQYSQDCSRSKLSPAVSQRRNARRRCTWRPLIAPPFGCPDEMTSASVMPLADLAAALKQWQGRGSAAEDSQMRPAADHRFLLSLESFGRGVLHLFFFWVLLSIIGSISRRCLCSCASSGTLSRGLSRLDQTKAKSLDG